MAMLTPDDADGLRDLADRSRRASATARDTAADDPRYGPTLTQMAGHLDAAATCAEWLAELVDPEETP